MPDNFTHLAELDDKALTFSPPKVNFTVIYCNLRFITAEHRAHFSHIIRQRSGDISFWTDTCMSVSMKY